MSVLFVNQQFLSCRPRIGSKPQANEPARAPPEHALTRGRTVPGRRTHPLMIRFNP